MIREDGDLMKVVDELRERIKLSMFRRDTYFSGNSRRRLACYSSESTNRLPRAAAILSS